MIRIVDIIFSILGLIIFSPLMLLIISIGFLETGAPIFTQTRLGRYQAPFRIVKFRTMKIDTASVATHFVDTASITCFGKILRHTKLDELPQLWNVLKGDMSLVGPRPGLLNQHDLTKRRIQHNVFSVKPGITGLSQINNIDMSEPERLAKCDALMIENLNLFYYFRIIILTLIGKGAGDKVVK